MYYFSYAQIIYNIPVSVSVGFVDQFILLLVSRQMDTMKLML